MRAKREKSFITNLRSEDAPMSDTMMVMVPYAPQYAKGGLVDEAREVKAASRNGDTMVIHINKDEYAKLVEQWGEPTINPETGLP